jgi:hypothetical protein
MLNNFPKKIDNDAEAVACSSPMTLRDHLVLLGQRYAAHKGLRISTVGAYLFNEGNLFGRLRDGGDIMTGRYEFFISVFSTEWPADLEWPAEVPRPKGQRAA